MSDVIPEGWVQTNINELTKSNALFSDGDWVESKDQDPNGTNRLIQLADIGDGLFVNKSSRFLNNEQFSRLKCTELKQNDILIARMPDPLGRACIYPLKNTKAATIVDIAIIRTANANHFWLMSAINSPAFRFNIELNASGTTRTRIARGALAKLPILAPPLPEQQKIAAILSSVDDVIEKTQAQIEKLKDLKIGMMQELLSPREPKAGDQTVTQASKTNGLHHTEFKDSPLGRIPVGWEVKRLGDIFPRIVVGYVGNVNDHYCDKDQGVPFYRTLNIRDGYIRNEPVKYVTKSFNDKNKKSQIFNEDILIARVGANLGMTCKVTGVNDSANIANAIIIKSVKNASSDFYMEYIRSDFGQRQILSEAAGGAQGVFNTKLAQELTVPVPPIEEQQEIGKKLLSFDTLINNNQMKLRQQKMLKSGLIQDLLTGKVRVTVPSHPCDHGINPTLHVQENAS